MIARERTAAMKRLVIGILAHVDAGKTTLSESLLYLTGAVRTLGRVDHKDAFLDTYDLEKERGITIFSKQAVMNYKDLHLTLLDTPGHVDFSAEMERTLQVLDYAVLVISGRDGVQSHTMTLWRLFEHYQVPVFLFINKMDQEGTDKAVILDELKAKLSDGCIDFDPSQEDAMQENVAFRDETLLETLLDQGSLSEENIQKAIEERKVFPCYFGSALKMTGVTEFLDGFLKYTRQKDYPSSFGAKVFKIARDEKGSRLTYMKITGGSLRVKDMIEIRGRSDEEEPGSQKVDQIRIYSGARFENAQEVFPGETCAVTGLTGTVPGEGLGLESDGESPALQPVLNYRLLLPEGCDPLVMLRKVRELEEEDPQLHIVWNGETREIHAMLMGEVQIEILKKLIWERFHVVVDFGAGRVVYRETIADAVEGVGHFEPLRHYAEVHLLLEPGERGSGLQFFTAVSEDVLNRNWQRLILTHLAEKEHLGVLTGSPITDMQITLILGRAHIKHTEGGDFRQATYRAVRQGLMKAKSVLLEPYYDFTLEIPSGMLGRAMTDIQKMQGNFQAPLQEGDTCILKGRAPVADMRDYQSQVTAYTRGEGRLFLSLSGYEPCRDQDEAVREAGYDPERDTANPTGSVFCAHGAGFVVPWYQVEEYMHLQSDFDEEKTGQEEMLPLVYPSSRSENKSYFSSEKEYEEFYKKIFGEDDKRLRRDTEKKVVTAPKEKYRAPRPKKPQDEYLLVDGYNMIFAWEELRILAKDDIHLAQDRLKDILCNYQGTRQCTLILVFDAYKVEGHKEEVQQYNNIFVVYTKEAETADQYIEKTVHKIGRESAVTVATSDSLEQIIIMGQGAVRMSADGLLHEIKTTEKQIREDIHSRRKSARTFVMDVIPEDVEVYLREQKTQE